MATVALSFPPPTEEDITTLHVFESDSPTGVFDEIDSTTEVGTFPDYITEFETALATSATGWFAIQWEDDGGALSPMSQPMQGGTKSLPVIVKERVMQRDPAQSDAIVFQESEQAVAEYFGLDDPYDADPNQPYSILYGLTLLAQARTLRFQSITSEGEGYTAGIVSQSSSKSGTQSTADFNYLIREAMRVLGLSFSVIMQMAQPTIAGVPGDGRIEPPVIIEIQ